MDRLDELLNGIEQRADAATPGPLTCGEPLPKSYSDHGYRELCRTKRGGNEYVIYAERDNMRRDPLDGGLLWGEDMEFFADARTTVPALAEALRECMRQRDFECRAFSQEHSADHKPVVDDYNAELIRILEGNDG